VIGPRQFAALLVIFVKIHLRTAGAVQAFGEDAGNGGLAGAARPQKSSMGDALLLDGMGKRLRDVLLATTSLKRCGRYFGR